MGVTCLKEGCLKFSMNKIFKASQLLTHPIVKLLIRRRIVKKHPVISNPLPVNPNNLTGRKWRNVIFTIPGIEIPPARPVRRKRNAPPPPPPESSQIEPKSLPSSTTTSTIHEHHPIITYQFHSDDTVSKYSRLVKYLWRMYLRQYLRVTKTGLFIGVTGDGSNWKCCHDLFISHDSVAEDRCVARKGISREENFTYKLIDTSARRANYVGFKNFPLHRFKGFRTRIQPRKWNQNSVNTSPLTEAEDEYQQLQSTIVTKANQKQHQQRVTWCKSDIKKVWNTVKKTGLKIRKRKCSTGTQLEKTGELKWETKICEEMLNHSRLKKLVYIHRSMV